MIRQGQPSLATPLQFAQFAVHVYEHVPFEQLTFWTKGRPLQLTALVPQAHGLLIGPRHAPPHDDVPAGHAHMPLVHVAPVGQTVVHEPQ